MLTVAKARLEARPARSASRSPASRSESTRRTSSGVGEVLARGPNVMVGYTDDAEATEARAIDADGWLHTGDLGKLDRAAAASSSSGASKDVIVTSTGENVYPDDVERMLGKVDDVEGARDRRRRRPQRRRARRLPRGARGRTTTVDSRAARATSARTTALRDGDPQAALRQRSRRSCTSTTRRCRAPRRAR